MYSVEQIQKRFVFAGTEGARQCVRRHGTALPIHEIRSVLGSLIRILNDAISDGYLPSGARSLWRYIEPESLLLLREAQSEPKILSLTDVANRSSVPVSNTNISVIESHAQKKG
ncbi:hypothetical protein [Paraburkholderia nodosa]|uniref:hypothetical protein n=1 Tax=Paraburkholderia nodosa TaxID=392320 RepID=UPI0012B6A604|nr:hypothetical protein [Paraburkholderia nodosa]